MHGCLEDSNRNINVPLISEAGREWGVKCKCWRMVDEDKAVNSAPANGTQFDMQI